MAKGQTSEWSGDRAIPDGEPCNCHHRRIDRQSLGLLLKPPTFDVERVHGGEEAEMLVESNRTTDSTHFNFPKMLHSSEWRPDDLFGRALL